jgi:hypothetical protein
LAKGKGNRDYKAAAAIARRAAQSSAYSHQAAVFVHLRDLRVFHNMKCDIVI